MRARRERPTRISPSPSGAWRIPSGIRPRSSGARDLGFDGRSAPGEIRSGQGITPFFNGGAFPVFNTDFNSPPTIPASSRARITISYGAQLGTSLKITKDISAKVSGQYYYYYKPPRANCPIRTRHRPRRMPAIRDDSRPSFAQNGNTYMALRNIIPDATNGSAPPTSFNTSGSPPSFTSSLSPASSITIDSSPRRFRSTANGSRNLALDNAYVNSVAVNNRGPDTTIGGVGAYSGGDTAWNIGIRVGKPAMEKFGDWNLSLDYRHVESDSVIDGFTDADFGAAALWNQSEGLHPARESGPFPATYGSGCGG
ncbi:MAG: putative porin [Chthoniobacter sp.]